MAFKIKRSIIHGTKAHKASIAKAKKEQAKQKVGADAALIEAANALGRSNIGKKIDYTLDIPSIKVPEFEKRKRKRERDMEEIPRMETETPGPDLEKREAPEFETPEIKEKKVNDKDVFNRKLNLSKEQDTQSDLIKSISEKDTKNIKVRKEGDFITQEDIREMNERAKKAAAFDPSDVRVYTKEEQARLKFDERTNEMRLPEEIAADKTVYSTETPEAVTSTRGLVKPKPQDFKNSTDYNRARMKYYKALEEQNSPAQKRYDKVFQNAIPNGTVQKNMIKNGYIPKNQM